MVLGYTYREQLIGNKNPIYAGSGCPYTSLSSCIIWVLRFLLNIDHRSNLIGMGILPLQFQGQDNIASLGLDGSETVSILGISDDLQPMQEATKRLQFRSLEATEPLNRL